jgi:phosphatidylcholine synthase
MDETAPADRSGPPAFFAWLVHAFTATGAVLAFLALVAILEEQWRLALFWLVVALVVDGVDGSFARWARVKEKAGRIDGDTLDLVIDYLTYVFVPTLFLWRAGLIPESLVLPLGALIQYSALYHFARSDMKSADNYFRGFPALWNLVAFYLFVAEADPQVGAIAVVALAALTFAPVHFVHPFRVRDYGRWLPVLALIWALVTSALLWPRWSDGMRAALLAISLATAAVLLAMGLLRSLRGARKSR